MNIIVFRRVSDISSMTKHFKHGEWKVFALFPIDTWEKYVFHGKYHCVKEYEIWNTVNVNKSPMSNGGWMSISTSLSGTKIWS